MLTQAQLTQIVDPPATTIDLPGIGGNIRARPEDFRVTEIPAYDPDGRNGGHLLLVLRKRGLTTEQALREVARSLDLARGEIGYAGLKDRDAVTEQWISIPSSSKPALVGFAHEDIELGPPHPHSHKLRRGHLRGNHFEITIRDTAVATERAVELTRAKLEALVRAGGLDNPYGRQRFGHDGRNASDGLALLRAGRRRRRGDLVLSAGQSALFNLVLLMRRQRGLGRTVLEGDVLKKTETGGLFTCSAPATDQARLEAGEVVITGPMFGSKMMTPPEGSPARVLEHEALELTGIDEASLAALGRAAPGSRRALWVEPGDPRVRAAPPVEPDGLGPGVVIAFTLPSGSYATVLCREVQSGADPGAAGL